MSNDEFYKGFYLGPVGSKSKPDLACAVALCKLVEPIAKNHQLHVALTGGCLYGEGQRKDMDILFYQVRQPEHFPDVGHLFDDLATVSLYPIKVDSIGQWCVKCEFIEESSKRVYSVDCFFPEKENLVVWGEKIDNASNDY